MWIYSSNATPHRLKQTTLKGNGTDVHKHIATDRLRTCKDHFWSASKSNRQFKYSFYNPKVTLLSMSQLIVNK